MLRKKTWVIAGAGLGPAAVALDPRSLPRKRDERIFKTRTKPTNGEHHWRISSGLRIESLGRMRYIVVVGVRRLWVGGTLLEDSHVPTLVRRWRRVGDVDNRGGGHIGMGIGLD